MIKKERESCKEIEMEGRTRDEGVCCETLKGEKTREGGEERERET